MSADPRHPERGAASPPERDEHVAPLSSAYGGLPRAGVGVDVHPFGEEQPLRLAGLDWPGEPRLVGHSDGDVAAHAAGDALLSAAGLGDLGVVVGTERPQWARASGPALLSEVTRVLGADGWVIGNVAIQVVGNHPRLADRRSEAENALSRAIGAPVGLSATTTDGLGLTGRGEGLAAIATAIIARR